MKLKCLKAYDTANVPDHVLEEITALAHQMGLKMEPFFIEKSPNLVLSAFGFLHAAILKRLISNDKQEIEKAAKISAVGLIKNIELLIRLQEEEDMEKKDLPNS